MIASRGTHICSTVYIPSNWKDIRITDMNELGDMPEPAFKEEWK